MIDVDRVEYIARSGDDRIFFAVDGVDNEVFLFDKKIESLRAGKNSCPMEIQIDAERKYVIRYNNNDSNEGYFKCRVMQRCKNPDAENLIFQLNWDGIDEPTVREVSFIVYYKGTL